MELFAPMQPIVDDIFHLARLEGQHFRVDSPGVLGNGRRRSIRSVPLRLIANARVSVVATYCGSGPRLICRAVAVGELVLCSVHIGIVAAHWRGGPCFICGAVAVGESVLCNTRVASNGPVKSRIAGAFCTRSFPTGCCSYLDAASMLVGSADAHCSVQMQRRMIWILDKKNASAWRLLVQEALAFVEHGEGPRRKQYDFRFRK